MRRSGGISLERGRYRARVRMGETSYEIGTFDTREEAERKLAVFLSVHAGKEALTFATWGRQCLERRATDGHHRDEKRDRNRWAQIEKAQWAHYALVDITRQHIVAWVAEMVASGAQRSTVTNKLNLARVFLRGAQDEGLIETNPALDVRVPKIARADDPWTWLTLDEIAIIEHSTVLPPLRRIAYTLDIYTGLRPGELWGLRWGDVYLDHAEPHILVRRSYKGPTKTGKAREVPLLPSALRALRELRVMSPDAKPEHTCFPPADKKFRKGRDPHAVASRDFDAGWRETWRRRLGIREDVRMYDFRHTCASHLVQGSWGRVWTLPEIQMLLGHTSITMTQRYAHLSPAGLRGAVRATRGA